MSDSRASTGGRDLALVMGGGGARAAYQVGILRWLARREPDLHVPILVGVSAGAINAAFLASRDGNLRTRVEALADLWRRLETHDVLKVDAMALVRHAFRAALGLVSGGPRSARVSDVVVDSRSLWSLLGRAFDAREDEIPGIEANLKRGTLKGIAITACSYTTGQSVTWIQGRVSASQDHPHRRSVDARLGLRHVIASSSLPIVFPAVEIDGEWFGDGGLGLTAPLFPAVHLGADAILAITTRHKGAPAGPPGGSPDGHPGAAQIVGSLFDSVFPDLYDTDALSMVQRNEIVRAIPPGSRRGLRVIRPIVLRPSRDLGALANDLEPQIPRAIGRMLPGLGARGTRSREMLTMLMFQPDYLSRLIDLGEADAEDRRDEVEALLGETRQPGPRDATVSIREEPEVAADPRRPDAGFGIERCAHEV